MSKQNPKPEQSLVVVVDEYAALLADAPPVDAATRRKVSDILREAQRAARQSSHVAVTPPNRDGMVVGKVGSGRGVGTRNMVAPPATYTPEDFARVVRAGRTGDPRIVAHHACRPLRDACGRCPRCVTITHPPTVCDRDCCTNLREIETAAQDAVLRP